MRARTILVVLVASGAPALAQERPLPAPSPRPVTDSVERVVERMEAERTDPCHRAHAEGRPCFAITTTITGPTYSVRQSLGVPDLQAGKPAPGGAPTVAEMGPYRPGPESTVAPLVRFDPGCVGKSFLKSLKGKNDTYYLYRLRDRQGDRVEMTDHKLDVATFQGEIEFLGRFDGECDAVAAYRREQARLVPPAPTPGPPASPSPSPPTAQR